MFPGAISEMVAVGAVPGRTISVSKMRGTRLGTEIFN